VEESSFSFTVDVSDAIDELQEFFVGLSPAKLNAGLTEEESAQWDDTDEADRGSFRESVRQISCREAQNGGWEVIIVRNADESILSIAKAVRPGNWQFMDFDGEFRRALNANVRESRTSECPPSSALTFRSPRLIPLSVHRFNRLEPRWPCGLPSAGPPTLRSRVADQRQAMTANDN
jgi:hypothetical protein